MNSNNPFESMMIDFQSLQSFAKKLQTETEEDREKKEIERKREQKVKAEAALNKLVSLPGLKEIKTQVNQIISLNTIAHKRRELGLKCENQSLHMIFKGNPGTGKTTAARLIGEAFMNLGLLKSDKDEIPFVEVHHSDVESAFVGQAEKAMNEKFEEARGGVLFMDEAYSFVGPRHYHKTFIANLVQKIEDMRDEVLVIAAGYADEMEDFLDSNPGLRSRFSNVINFTDYTNEDLVKIADLMCSERDYVMTDPYKRLLEKRLDKEKRISSFGNARTVRNIIEQSIRMQSARLSNAKNPTKEDLMSLQLMDIELDVPIPVKKTKNDKFGTDGYVMIVGEKVNEGKMKIGDDPLH